MREFKESLLPLMILALIVIIGGLGNHFIDGI